MDEASNNITLFLEALQDGMRQLGEVWSHFSSRGTRPERPYLVLSGSPFRIHEKENLREFNGCVAVGLKVTGTDTRKYELGIDILWNREQWTLTTEAWVDTDEDQQLLRKLPERVALDTEACLAHLKAAISDLIQFEDLVPGTKPAV